MDFNARDVVEPQVQEAGFAAKIEDLNDLQLALVGGGCGDVIFA